MSTQLAYLRGSLNGRIGASEGGRTEEGSRGGEQARRRAKSSHDDRVEGKTQGVADGRNGAQTAGVPTTMAIIWTGLEKRRGEMVPDKSTNASQQQERKGKDRIGIGASPLGGEKAGTTNQREGKV